MLLSESLVGRLPLYGSRTACAHVWHGQIVAIYRWLVLIAATLIINA